MESEMENLKIYSSDDEYSTMTPEEKIRYHKEVEESDGFDVGRYFDFSFFGMIKPIAVESQPEEIMDCTKLGIQRYNKKENANLKLVKIIKANWKLASPYCYYITFQATNLVTGETGIYQTLVYVGVDWEDTCVDFTRLKPKSKMEGTNTGEQGVEEEKEGKRSVELEAKEEKEVKKLKCC